jgi:hypothetical protein
MLKVNCHHTMIKDTGILEPAKWVRVGDSLSNLFGWSFSLLLLATAAC